MRRAKQPKALSMSKAVKAQLKKAGIPDPRRSRSAKSLAYPILEKNVEELTEGNIRLAKELIALKSFQGLDELKDKIRSLEIELLEKENSFKRDMRLAYEKAVKRCLHVLSKHCRSDAAHDDEEQEEDFAAMLVKWELRPIMEEIADTDTMPTRDAERGPFDLE